MRVCAFFLILSTAGLATASAQSLADVARKEGERRQATKESGKVYTNKDLKPVPQPPPGADATPAADADKTAAAAGAADNKADAKTDTGGDKAGTAKADKGAAADKRTTDDKEVKDQAYWSNRMAALRDQLERDQTFLQALQNRIDALTADFVNRDDPAQRGQIANDRQKALGELDRMKKTVEQDKRAIPELEEEARRAGVPAGWLR